MTDGMKPYLVCCGTNGNCVIYGYSDSDPVSGEPCLLHNAKMIIYWGGSSGLIGLASRGPSNGSRITASVTRTGTDPVKQWVDVSKKAAESLDQWEPC